ncbi:MAG: hypothetical protein WEC75_04570 [Dehalococcoidia bacterium]
MLTPLDDYLVHQIPEPVERVFTSDRNFYDRYYFGANTLDGSVVMIVAFGLYPNMGVMDAFAAVVVDNTTEHILRASRELGHDRMDTKVGPIGVQVLEPLRTMRVYAEPNEHNLSFDLTFEGVTFPFEEPHFFRRGGPRAVMDYTRMTQNGRWSGKLTAGDRTFDVAPDSWWGAKDHSWGIRPLGGDPPAAPPRDGQAPGFFWTWTPVQFDDACLMYTCSEDGDGSRWHSAAELLRPYGKGEPEHLTVVGHDLKLKAGTRLFDGGTLRMARRDGSPVAVTMQPKSTIYMSGAGYAYLGGWRHAQYHGPLVVEGETWDLRDAETVRNAGIHTQTVCDYRVDGLDVGAGHGVFEFLSLGAYLPYGFKTFADVAP